MASDRRKVAFTWLYLLLLSYGLGAGLFLAAAYPMDDHFLYQRFVESLAAGTFDLSIPGFHGSDFFVLPWYLLSGSPIAQIQVQMVFSLLLPPLAYLAGKSLYRSQTLGILLATIIAMMPFLSFVSLRGWTGSAFMCLTLLTVTLAARRSPWTGLTWALAILTKPFAVALLPLLIVIAPSGGSWWRRYHPLLLAGFLVCSYLLLQISQVGHIIVGAHPTLDQANVWQGPVRILLNAAHTLQILFSVHNYYYPDPSLTGPGNMLHTTPVLMMLGLFALLSPKQFFRDRRLALALGIGAVIAFGLNMLLDHMDHYYMETGVLLLILAALPALKRYPLWIPVVIATLHFQWFYFWLEYGVTFSLTPFFFMVPVIVDVAMVIGGMWWLMQKESNPIF